MGEACMATFWPTPGLKWRTFDCARFSTVGTWISKSVYMEKLSQLAYYIYISINIYIKMSIGVWSTLPIFLPIHLHGSLQVQCHAQLTYISIHIYDTACPFSQLFSKKQTCALIYWSMQVHLHAGLVYLYTSVTGIVATPLPIHSVTSLVNKLETPIHTHTHTQTDIYISIYGSFSWKMDQIGCRFPDELKIKLKHETF